MTDILFVLPVAGGSGGAHSVMQEADAMRRLGADARIAVNRENAARLAHAYRDLPAIAAHFLPFSGDEGLAALIAEHAPRMVVATTNQSVHSVAAAIRPGQATAYYIQDYEPLFYPHQSDDWLVAHASFGLIPGMIHFAKTGWLQEVVGGNHRVDVHKVEASIDHGVFYPDIGEAFAKRERLRVAAMVRPSTPRRAPRRTVRMLNRLAETMGERLQCTAFGCSAEELRANGLALDDRVAQRGTMERAEVGALFRETDLFLDLSDYQAFGRTALEAMSCGAIALVPAHGGAREFATDGRNALIVDTRDDTAIEAAVTAVLGMTEAEQRLVRLNAVATGYRYSPEVAALSELRLLLGV